MKRIIKHFLPQGLLGRSLLILSMPLLLVQVGLIYIFFERHTETVLRLLAHNIAGDVATVARLLEKDPPLAFEIAKNNFRFQLKRSSLPIQENSSWLLQFLKDAFKEHLTIPYVLSIQGDDLIIGIKSAQESFVIRTTLKRLFSRTTPLVLIFTGSLAFLTLVIAALFMRSQIRPIRHLANAARSFGKGSSCYPLKQAGALEVRQASQEFNDMRDRIKRHLSERFEMLACLSHDLRTPLTRLKLQIACMPTTNDSLALQEDVNQMHQMLETFLTYARSQAHEALQDICLYDFLSHLKKDFPLMSFVCPLGLNISVRPGLFKRCFVNLMNNAKRFSKHVDIQVMTADKDIFFIIDDDGPGIEESERDAVFRPFYRSDSSRNLDDGGVGLGLSIVRDIVHNHGGYIHLDHSPQGGLRVIIGLEREH